MRSSPAVVAAATGAADTIGGATPRVSNLVAITIIGAMFFVFGFVTWLNGPLISFVKLAFSLSDFEAFLVPMVFYLSYFFLALPAAAILRRSGLKRGMVIGLATMAVGTALFGQFATMRLFSGTLCGLFVIGGGLAVLQTAANPYIAILGPIESAAQRIAVMGICNKLAGMLAPIAFGLLIMQGVGTLADRVAVADPAQRELLLEAFASQIHWPYLGMAGLLALLAAAVFYSPLPNLAGDGPAGQGGSVREAWRFRHLRLGVICLFLYMGAEVMAGDAIGLYGDALGLPVEQTAYFASLTLAAMLIGYVVGLAVIPRFISQDRYLALSAVIGMAAVTGSWLSDGYVAVGFVAALGFANAMMWPAIFPLAIRDLGRHTETGSAMLIMAICGGAIIPQLYAGLKQVLDFQLVFLILMVPVYLYILYYALRGHRPADAQQAA
ncbi:sugar MFS transporter [Sphingomonas koreensis]|uniref:Sugar MFS transporter n=2 Tax=Sphingomonas koreensis TaxID=93064 RepID=A0A430FZU0_9SPHN|nr:sugar MFS transporter [Sphingomonas koreensis]